MEEETNEFTAEMVTPVVLEPFLGSCLASYPKL